MDRHYNHLAGVYIYIHMTVLAAVLSDIVKIESTTGSCKNTGNGQVFNYSNSFLFILTFGKTKSDSTGIWTVKHI